MKYTNGAPAAVHDDAEQLRLDLDDANLRLDNLREAMIAKEKADDEVKFLTRQLAQAKRRAKEAGWKLALLLARERQ